MPSSRPGAPHDGMHRAGAHGRAPQIHVSAGRRPGSRRACCTSTGNRLLSVAGLGTGVPAPAIYPGLRRVSAAWAICLACIVLLQGKKPGGCQPS